MTRPQWWLDPTALDVLALCKHLDARTSSNPDYIDDFAAPSGDQDLRRLISIAEDQRLLRSASDWADAEHVYYPVLITPPGRRRLRMVDDHRDRHEERIVAARQGLLLWAYRHAVDNPDLPMNSPRRFLEADPSYNFWGEPFTEMQVREATEYLVEAGLLELFGQRLANGEPQNVSITRTGKDCVEGYEGSAAAYLRRHGAAPAPATYTQHFHAPFQGQNAQGDNISQTQHIGLDRDAIAAIFIDLRALLSQVDDADDQTDLTVAIDDLERAVSHEEPDLADVSRRVGLLNRLASRVGNTAVNTSTNAATNGLLDLLGNVIS
jgi:hypothetical protein